MTIELAAQTDLSTEELKAECWLDEAYSTPLFNIDQLKLAVRECSAVLTHLKTEHGAFHLAATGKSGIAFAFALSVMYGWDVVAVRKIGEQSHGASIEGRGVLNQYIIVDDFVGTGDTLRNVVKRLNDYAGSRRAKQPRCLGFIEYHCYTNDERTRCGDMSTESGPISNLTGA